MTGALAALAAAQAAQTGQAGLLAWWVWPLALFATCFVIGVIAVPAGIGGGTLFVPIVGSFFPFHLDFVRGVGLLVALASALVAVPTLLRSGLANLRLALPLALLASASAVAGALLGLALPGDAVQTALGALVLAMAGAMLIAGPAGRQAVRPPDALGAALGLRGSFVDGATGQQVEWHASRTAAGLVLFVLIGLLGGIFGIGAGWANVPVLNLLMGLPLKAAAGTSGVVLSLASSAAAWVYIGSGAVLPMIAVPSVIGMMLGARLGARLLERLNAAVVRRLVIVVLLFAGLRALLKGLGVWP